MDQKVIDFIYINGIVILLLVLYMAFWRPKRQPSRLKLRPTASKIDHGVRQLNVIFQFNGHDFDAYEVLGLPAGSSRDKAEAAYTKTIQGADPDSHEFYRHAIEAIRKS